MDIIADNPLPITLKADSDIVKVFPMIGSICNKLEAKLNFIAMTANWFSNEKHEISLCFNITINDLNNNEQLKGVDEIIEIADDAMLVFHKDNFHYEGLLAITEPEQMVIDKQQAVLPLLLDKKCTLMLNAVAERESLTKL